jgi:hypothetical protein
MVSSVIVQQYLDRCTRIRCRGNPLTDQLPNDVEGTVHVFAVRYRATVLVPLFPPRSVRSSRHEDSVACRESDGLKEYIANLLPPSVSVFFYLFFFYSTFMLEEICSFETLDFLRATLC